MFTAKTVGSVCNAGFPVLLIRSPHRTEAKLARRIGFYSLLLAVYLVSTVPVGLFLYSLKTAVGFDLFKGVECTLTCSAFAARFRWPTATPTMLASAD